MIQRIKFSILISLALSLLMFFNNGVANEISTNANNTVLITGANRGIGLALASEFHNQGFKVIATARNPASATNLNRLGVRVEQLDIASQASVNELAQRLRDMAIDIVINNAGIGGHSANSFEDLNIDKLAKTFSVNSLGSLRVVQALLPNLRAASKRVVVSISSRMGSIESNSRGCCYGYRASKGALNNFNMTLSKDYEREGFTFVVLHPGWVRTDMTSDAATYTPEQSAEKLYKVISTLAQKDNGRFYNLNGQPLPW